MAVKVPDLGAILAASGGPFELDRDLGDSTHPLALFPVRLETRFFGTELRVRVYPDKVHLDSHDPALSANERLWGRRYWELEWQAGSDDGMLRAAWRMVASRLGPERAAWVVRALRPTNPGDRPAGTPVFPDLGDPAEIARTPLVRLLPDRWVATAYAGGAAVAAVAGNDITHDLAIGPDLEADVTIDDEVAAVDEGMRWMVDFDRAEQVGMALRMRLPTAEVDVLLVVGTSDGDRSADVAAQLDAHHVADGLAFLPPGSPTNNSELGRTPYQAPDPQHDLSFADELLAGEPAAGSNAARAQWAFGVSSFEHASGAGDLTERVARAMTRALWPTTWGYFLTQMIGFDGTGLTLGGVEQARTHATEHVRAGGPLPVLRIGRQPYGVLPVTSLDSWVGAGLDESFRDLLVRLRGEVWRPASFAAPRVGRTDDASVDLATVLEAAGLSTSYRVRNTMGLHFLQHLRAFLGEDLPSFVWPNLVELTSQQTSRVGIGFVPALAHTAHEGVARTVTAPLVGDPAYVADLLAVTDPDTVTDLPDEAQPLLRVLLRPALLREPTAATARAVDPADPALLRDTELVDLLPGSAPTPTWSWIRRQQVSGRPAADLAGDDPSLADFRAALRTLAGTDAATLERHLAETLDAASYRLDAWITSLATRRLAEMRTARRRGLQVGGYGWVENLRPATPGPAVDDVPDEPGPLTTPADDPGFIHAPSLNQASTAALLRNAHLSHGGERSSPYAIELTSARVRLAKQLFEGVRQGQPIGALLGYSFERTLHNAGLDDLVDDFRALAPLPGAATPSGVRRLVVDGLLLARMWNDDPDQVIAPGDPRHELAAKVLDTLEDAVDAAADALHAEGAFQMVRGNPARAASSLDAVSTGQVPPPDLAFLRTPRTGTGLTHRVALFVDADPGPDPAGWAPRDSSPRAKADPALHAWAGRLLGSAVGVSARVEEPSPDGEVTAVHDVTLTSLGLTPIDLVWATGGVDGQPPEVVARLQAEAGVAGRVDLSRAAGGLGDLVEVAARTQRLLAGARPLHGADLQPPHADPALGQDLDELESRVVAAETSLRTARDRLRQAVDDGGVAGIREAMWGAAAFGVPGAVPTPGAGTGTAQASAVLAEVSRRLDGVDDDGDRSARLLARLRTVFGAGFLALPRFTAANADDLAGSVADAALGGDDPLAAYTWLQRMERVRPPLSRMTRPLRHSQILGHESLDLRVAQVPHVAGQRWVGLDLVPGADPVDGAASLVLQSAPEDFTGSLCGLLVDEWTELVPRREETTGVAFQLDPPDASAPQAILLAVPPVVGEPWTVGRLNRVLLETLDLTRLRAVNPAALGDVAHFLPATYLAFNPRGDAVTSDLNLLTQTSPGGS
ncbi:MAG TPA: hypothetical protein VER39_00300 [Nocardioidaceae bacterium]|nr:hypothetical protein [Nocardioidaceae bacterium]